MSHLNFENKRMLTFLLIIGLLLLFYPTVLNLLLLSGDLKTQFYVVFSVVKIFSLISFLCFLCFPEI